MHKIMKRKSMAALAILGVVAGISGCLISGTKVFTLALSDIQVTGGVFERTLVDLTANSTFNDHRDKIRLIDRFGFTCSLVNPNAEPLEVSVYFSTNPGLGDVDVPTQATPLFLNLAVPASSTRSIGYDESVTLIQNFEALAAVVETGQFTFYSQSVNGSGFDFTIDDPVLIVTFTVGL